MRGSLPVRLLLCSDLSRHCHRFRDNAAPSRDARQLFQMHGDVCGYRTASPDVGRRPWMRGTSVDAGRRRQIWSAFSGSAAISLDVRLRPRMQCAVSGCEATSPDPERRLWICGDFYGYGATFPDGRRRLRLQSVVCGCGATSPDLRRSLGMRGAVRGCVPTFLDMGRLLQIYGDFPGSIAPSRDLRRLFQTAGPVRPPATPASGRSPPPNCRNAPTPGTAPAGPPPPRLSGRGSSPDRWPRASGGRRPRCRRSLRGGGS